MNDRRVLTDRASDAADQLDRIPSRQGGTPIFAGRVYDGGNMPSTVPAWYLTHPVDFSGDESEGGSYAATADSSLSVPVIVLGEAAKAGDILIAEMVGSKWVAEIGGHKSRVCVRACARPVFGAFVEVLDDAAKVIADGTTDATGCCDIDASGTHRVRVTVSGAVAADSTRTISGTLTIFLSDAAVVCCGPYAIPTHLTLTDGAGTVDFRYYPHSFFPIWFGGHAVQKTSCPVTTPDNVCVVGPPSEGPVKVCYQMVCFAGQPGLDAPFAVQRSWSWVYKQGALDPIWYQDASGMTPGLPCLTSPPAICGSPLTDTAGFNAAPSSTEPFTISGTPVDASANSTADPIGGGVVISA